MRFETLDIGIDYAVKPSNFRCRLVFQGLALTLAAALGSSGSFAQAYPTRAVRVIVPFPSGQAADVIARIVAQKLSDGLGQPVITDNRAGASGNIGFELGAKAPPDGYTLTLATAAISIAGSVFSKLPFDPGKDFAPITLMAITPLVLVVNPALPVRSVKELIALARARPGELNFASSGVGTTHQLAGELLKMEAKINIVHVPYKGSPAAHVDLISGQVTMMFDNIVPVIPLVRRGKLRALAVTTPHRAPTLPEVPSIVQAGLPDFEILAWFGMMAPANTPRDIVMRLHNEIVKILKLHDVRAQFLAMGAGPVGYSPEQFNAHVQREIAKWARIVKVSGARAD